MTQIIKTASARALTFVLTLTLLVACLLPVLTVPASAASRSTILAAIFDPDYYMANNSDVVRVYGTSKTSLRRHFDDFGAREGRRPSIVFDAAWYLNCYSDLKAAFGNNYEAALNHFLTYGIAEGRQGSAEFSVQIYKDNYSDLRAAFGTSSSDNWEYLRHYIQYGRSENRNATTRIASASQTSTMYVVTSDPNNRLNLRATPSTSGSILGKLSYGTAVSVLSTSNGWAKVQVNSTTGYLSMQYLSTSIPSSGSSAQSSAEQQIYDRLKAMANGSYGNGVYKTGTRYTGAFANEQCKGFAKKVHMILFGYNIGSTKSKPNNYQISISSSNTSLVGSLTGLSSDSAGKVSSLFSKARAGDFIQVRRSHGGSHSMIFLSSDVNGVTVYECNVDNRNGIQVATYSYDKFCSSNSGVSVYTPRDFRLH